LLDLGPTGLESSLGTEPVGVREMVVQRLAADSAADAARPVLAPEHCAARPVDADLAIREGEVPLLTGFYEGVARAAASGGRLSEEALPDEILNVAGGGVLRALGQGGVLG